jgi:hypothetical protein
MNTVTLPDGPALLVTLPDGPSLPRFVQGGITLNAILRAVFGADGAELAELRTLLPRMVLRTMVRDFRLEPTSERGERWHSRGVAFCPAKGGRAVVHRRALPIVDRVGATVGRSADGQES